MNTKRFETVLSALCAVSLALSIGAGCSKQKNETTTEVKGPNVEIMALHPTNYLGYVEIVGNIESPATVEFQAQVSGYLKSVSPKEGFTVKSNELLFEIDPALYEAAKSAAEAQLAIDQAKAAHADADLARNKELLDQEVISQSQYDSYDAAAKECAASVLLSQAKLNSANLDLSYTEIRAPYQGLLGEVNVRPGNLVNAGSTMLGSMNVTDPMWVSFPLSEQIYIMTTTNGVFKVTTDENGHESFQENDANIADIELVMVDGTTYSHKGSVFFVDREFSATTGTMKVKAKFPNPDGHLRPNQFAKVRIPAATYTNVFVIPQAATMQVQSITMAYVLGEDNKVSMRPLKVEYSANNEVVVADGLKEGEKIVLKGLLKLKNGMTVTPVTSEEAAKVKSDVQKETEANS
ncbi:MAG: efflux RND transporter periplasmic adaptor subunit [Verrucomicrobia bacterium]|nr:efflux RND transporter periplasmic adaptor subunit [Verrucomicrobiota bacterium]